MSCFKDLHCDLLDRYFEAEVCYQLFSNNIMVDGYIANKVYVTDNAIAAAQYYGMMCGYANAEKTIFGSDIIEQEMAKLGEIRLFEDDFEESS